jgi:hypothetical protein
MVHRRELNGEELVFGNQGALWQRGMTWWDHDTGSVWSQPIGEAIAGPRKGAKLELISSTLTAWDSWKETHPQTLALDAPGGRSGFDLAQMTIVLEFGEEVGVFPIPELWTAGPANTTVAGVPVAVVTDPAQPDRWAVFHREVDGQTLTLVAEGENLIDEETGTVWDPLRGLALEGPLAGEAMGVLPGFTAFLADTRSFWPGATVWTGA